MASFSKTSRKRLDTAHKDLQTLFNEVIKHFDCSILCGERGEEAQMKAFNDGFSKVKYPDSKHNKQPSLAVDAVPFPIEWKNTDRMRFFIGFVLGVAKMLKEEGKIKSNIISGIDWDNNTVLKDTRFQDFPHFQIK